MNFAGFKEKNLTGLAINTRLIRSDEQLLETFLDRFELLSGNPLDLGYLERATVRGFFKRDELVAGYVLNNRAPYRLLMWIPEDVRQQLIDKNISGGEHACCELTCMWKDRASISYWEMNWIYIFAIYDAVFRGKRNILGGSFVTKLANGQTRILENIVYSGPSSFKNGERCIVYFATRFEAVCGIFREVSIEIKRSALRSRNINL